MPTDDRGRLEDIVERRIREAKERGEFDDLAGSGKPLEHLDETYDPAWWAKRWVGRQHHEAEIEELRDERRRVRPRAAISEEAAERLRVIDARIAEIGALLDSDGRQKPQ